MAIDIKSLTPKQLNELIQSAESRKGELAKERVVRVREKIHALLKAEDLALADVFGGRSGPRKSLRPVPPKYRNPADPAQTWSGRGKHPRWFNAALAAGKKEKDLLI